LQGDRGGEVAVGDHDDGEGEDPGHEEGEGVDVVVFGDGVVGAGGSEDEQDSEGHPEGEERGFGVAPEGLLVEPDLVQEELTGHQLTPSFGPTRSR
jgi:hypothetical protein